MPRPHNPNPVPGAAARRRTGLESRAARLRAEGCKVELPDESVDTSPAAQLHNIAVQLSAISRQLDAIAKQVSNDSRHA